ncbi:F-box/kelch-repeat protein At3g23880-like [Silene latifolia]|uniref:F-box/kelch-repeat protein At3g23880-like n=1 Tax=Silene latifolia TaxID=37657 RepID=UPI003D76F180
MSINNLNGDVLTQILARLSVKTLLILRMVCKSWCSIIDDPSFMLIHIKQYYNGSDYDKTKLISLHVEKQEFSAFKGCWFEVRNVDTLCFSDSEFVTHYDFRNAVLAGSCFGLVLLLIKDDDPKPLKLWNPCLRKSIFLPTCPFTESDTIEVVYTLGYSNLTHCFKVCAFKVDNSLPYSNEAMPVAIYTVGEKKNNNQWRTITRESGSANIPVKGPKVDSEKGFLFFQGAAHCIAGDTHLLSFNFVSETFSWVELPDASEKTMLSAKYVFLLDEALAIMSLSEVNRRIWVMNKDDFGVVSWKLWFSCASSETDFLEVDRRIYLDPKVFYHNNGSTSFTLADCSYDIATSKVEELLKVYVDQTFTLCNYMESLALCKQSDCTFF